MVSTTALPRKNQYAKAWIGATRRAIALPAKRKMTLASDAQKLAGTFVARVSALYIQPTDKLLSKLQIL
jgi:hypothetical protein